MAFADFSKRLIERHRFSTRFLLTAFVATFRALVVGHIFVSPFFFIFFFLLPGTLRSVQLL